MQRLYQGIITQVNNLIFENWTLPRYVEVLGPQQTQRWVAVSGPQLKGKYNYDVRFTDESETQSEKMEALQLYSLLSQDPTVDALALKMFLVGQFNDPAFGRIFDASIQSALQQRALREPGGGGVSQGGGGGQSRPGALPSLPGGNGQTGRFAAQR